MSVQARRAPQPRRGTRLLLRRSSLRRGQRTQGGRIPLGERADDTGTVGDPRPPALVGGLLAGEHEQPGRSGTLDPSVCGISSASVKAA
jgi:hypothetical protein